MQKMLSYVRRAVDHYNMIKEGDRVAVGVSGGKDSLALLVALTQLSRFYPEKFEVVAITLEMGYDEMDFSPVQALCDRLCKEKLQGYLAPEAADSLEMIITSVESQKEAEFKMSFDPTLVRGMSYYTGTIFEISMDEFGGSVGGGGRYDKMIGKFTGQDTPAVGFSIGFERIVMLLLERGYEVPTSKPKKAFLIEKKLPQEKLLEVLEEARKEREAGRQVMIVNMKKNKKFQKEQLAEQGYTDITEVYNG